MSSSQNAKLTKQQRRDAAREQARKLREAQQRREKRNRLLIIVGALVFIAIVIAAIISIVVAANRAPLEGVDDQPSAATEEGAIPVGADGDSLANMGKQHARKYVATRGTRYIREWRGTTYEVIVQSARSFEFNGRTYKSLSAIASEITGTHWNGKRFFGVD